MMNPWKLLPLVLVSCAASPAPKPSSPPTLTEATPLESPMGAPLASFPDVYVAIQARSHARYEPEALGLGGYSVGIRLTNVGPRDVPIGPLHVTFTTTREGVPFPCRDHVLTSFGSREPSWLGPGQSFRFERELDCTLPLPGFYDVRAFVRLGDDASGRATEDAAGTFHLELENGPYVPQRYPSREGLYVMMTGRKVTKPLSPEAWARGDYRVLIATINGGHRRVPVGPARVAFSTYRRGSQLPCSGQAETLDLPDELAPGSMHVAASPVACAPAEEGHYAIVGHFTLGDGHEVDIGRIALEVTRDPARFTPELWPPVPSYPSLPGFK